MADKSVTDVLAEVMTSAAEHAVKNAKFDVSAYGVITEKEGQHYKIAVFGGEYGIVTNHDYIVGQKVVVTALQGNFRNLIVSESNTSVEILTVKSLVTGVDSLNAEFESMKDKSQQTEDTVQDQLKNTINTWYRNGHPHTYNYPASDWKTDEEKQAHVNDMIKGLAFAIAGYMIRISSSISGWKLWMPVLSMHCRWQHPHEILRQKKFVFLLIHRLLHTM
jgi:hypothetical protein